MVKNAKMPKIIGVKDKTLLDYKREDYLSSFAPVAADAKSLFSDHEVILLILWALISPSAGLAYLIWKKYPRMKWLAIPLIVVSVFQFIGQWGGFLWLFTRFVGGV